MHHIQPLCVDEKKGDIIEMLVGAIRRSLDPRADVVVSDRVEGPDGRRDMDVAVLTTLEGRPHLVLIECKNWKRAVGINVIDALESKARDLDANETIVYSNSGYTEQAIAKANRVGIQLCIPMSSENLNIGVRVARRVVARIKRAVKWELVAVGPPDRTPPQFHPHNLHFEGLPVLNWIRDLSTRLIQSHSHPDHHSQFAIQDEIEFTTPQVFSFDGEHHELIGLILRLYCTDGLFEQDVHEDVEPGISIFCVVV